MPRTTTYETASSTEAAIAAAPVAGTIRRVSWGAILGGVVISLITQFLLSVLGLGVGVSTVDPLSGGTPGAGTLSMSSAIWWTVSGIIAAFVGGWVAARLAGTSDTVVAALHGLVTWATTMLVVFYLLTTAAGALIGGAFNVVGGTLAGSSQALRTIVPGALDASGPFADLRREVEGVLQRTDLASAAETITAVTRVVTSGPNASAADRDRAAQLLSQHGGISAQEARDRLTQWTEAYQRNADEIRQQAQATAEATARVVSRAAIYGFVALLLGALAGAIGGRMGTIQATEIAVD